MALTGLTTSNRASTASLLPVSPLLSDPTNNSSPTATHIVHHGDTVWIHEPLPKASPWELAMRNAMDQLKKHEMTLIFQVKTSDDLVRIVAQMQTTNASKPLPRMLTRLAPFLSVMRSFSSVVDTFINSNPSIAALVWGSVKLLLEFTIRSVETLEKLIDVLNDIAAHLPRFETYFRLFPDAALLETALVYVYADFIEFCIVGIKFFRRNSFVNVLRSVWSSFENEFGPVVSRLKLHREFVELEAFAAYAVKGEHRHQELMGMMTTQRKTDPGEKQVSHHIIPYIAPSSFTGREDILDELYSHFDGAGILQLPMMQRKVALVGIGGVGKTQIALQYAYSRLEHYPTIFWVSAETEVKLFQDFVNIATTLNLDSSANSLQPTRARDLVLRWLHQNKEKWLIVFDNVEDICILQPFWPKANHGSILITTRYADLARSASAHSVMVEPFDEDHGARLLQILTDCLDDHFDIARKICRKLGGLALGIAHAAGFIRESSCSLEDFDEIYEKRKNQIEVHSLENKHAVFQYDRSLSTAWAVSIAALGTDSRVLLDILFFLDPDVIPEKIFTSDFRYHLPPELEFTRSKLKYLTTVSALNRRALINRNSSAQFLSLHRLVQVEISRSWNTQRHQKCFDLASALLNAAFPPHENGESMTAVWPECALLLPHVLCLHGHFTEDPFLVPSVEFVDLLTRCGWNLYERGLNSKSVLLLLAAEKICCDRFSNSLLLADVYTGLACNAKNLNKKQEAKIYAERILSIRESLLPANHIQLANACNDYGLAMNNLDELHDAEALHLRAISIKESIACPYMLLCQSYLNLGRVLTRQGRLEDANAMLQKASEAARNGGMTKGAYLAILLYAVGNVRVEEGLLEEALNLHVQALVLRKEFLGGDVQYTGLSCHKIAMLRYMQGAPAEAVDLMREALRIFQGIEGVEGDVARSSARLAQMLQALNQNEEASMHMERACQIREKLTGHPSKPGEDDYDAFELLTAYDNR